jgi:ribonuclease BN (tRNA processing enzyme)
VSFCSSDLLPGRRQRQRACLDCGATSLTVMRQQQLDSNEIDTVLIGHLHGDHFGGVPFL